MSDLQILLVAGTHGNEINAPWLFDQWDRNLGLINTNGIKAARVIGNPEAFKSSKRYLDCDLNRSFLSELINSAQARKYEISRAKSLLNDYGPQGINPCQIAIDFHSTTSSMGSSLVIYGRRYADLAIAALLQRRLGLPIYLHEGDDTQKGFLVESWPCGFVVEIGPVSQNVLDFHIVNQTRLILDVCLEELRRFILGLASFPQDLIIHRHLGSIDFPRTQDGKIAASIHPSRLGQDWFPISNGSPLFLSLEGNSENYQSDEITVPVFINEAAYVEKNIAMSLTKREIWPVQKSWKDSLNKLVFI